jgi:hypothetical protein
MEYHTKEKINKQINKTESETCILFISSSSKHIGGVSPYLALMVKLIKKRVRFDGIVNNKVSIENEYMNLEMITI